MYANQPPYESFTARALRSLRRVQMQRGLAFGIILVGALLAFELFNYSTTDFALTDLLGEVTFLSVRWATILAVAFCAMDFAGIARLFTPEKGQGDRTETWYLMSAWLLAATMNAMLTWWGVSLALIENNHELGNEILSREQLLNMVPIFVAALVWLIRILIIGTFSMAGPRLFSQVDSAPVRPARPHAAPGKPAPAARPARMIGGEHEREPDEYDQRPRGGDPRRMPAPVAARPMAPPAQAIRPAPKPMPASRPAARTEPNGRGNGSDF